MAWKEEVLLSDGDVVVVERTAHGKQMRELGGPGGWDVTEMTLDLKDPSTGAALPQWKFPFVPLIVDRDPKTKTWTVVATFYYCTSWYDLGRPALPYIQYDLQGAAWKKVPLDAAMIGRSSNLLASVRSGGEPELVTRSSKFERDRDASESFRQIVGVWKTTC